MDNIVSDNVLMPVTDAGRGRSDAGLLWVCWEGEGVLWSGLSVGWSFRGVVFLWEFDLSMGW